MAENLIEIENISDFEITHAIIFDDGDELAVDVYNYLKNNNITTRLIKIKITLTIMRVHNLRTFLKDKENYHLAKNYRIMLLTQD